MDAEHERIDPNDPLRSLFKGTGRLVAPSNLEDLVTARLAVQPVKAVEPPLISRTTWMVSIGLLFSLIMIGLILSPASQTQAVPLLDLPAWVQFPQLVDVLASRWVLAVLAGIANLVLIDHLIGRRFRAVRSF